MLSIDPMTVQYPNWSPYAFAANNPILFVDNEGENPLIALLAKGGLGAVIDAAIQFALNLIINGGNPKKAFDAIDWKQAAFSGAQSMIPWNSPGKRYGKAAVESAQDIAFNFATGKYRGLTTSELAEQVVFDFFVGAGFSFLSDAGSAKVKAWINNKKAIKNASNQKPAIHVSTSPEVAAGSTVAPNQAAHTKTTTNKPKTEDLPNTGSGYDTKKFDETPVNPHVPGTFSVYGLANKRLVDGKVSTLYVGMSKNGVDGRYSYTFRTKNGPTRNLINDIRADKVRGVEQAIIDLNGGTDVLKNKINSTTDPAKIKAGKEWLDQHYRGWRKSFNFKASKSSTNRTPEQGWDNNKQ